MKRFLILSSIFLAYVGIPMQAQANIGVSPASFTNDRLLSSSEISQEYLLSDSGNTEDSTYQFTVSSSLTSLVTVVEGSTLVMRKADISLPFHVRVIVPENMAPGKYSGSIDIVKKYSSVSESVDSAEPTARTDETISLPVSLLVQTKEIQEAMISDITTSLVEPNWVVPVFFVTQNTGNVPFAPKYSMVTITDMANEKIFFNERVPLEIEPISPFTEAARAYTIRTATPLEPGTYWLNSILENEQKKTLAQRKVLLEVVPEDSITAEPQTDFSSLVFHSLTTPTNAKNIFSPNTEISARMNITNPTDQWLNAQFVTTVFFHEEELRNIEQAFVLRPRKTESLSSVFTLVDPGKYTIYTSVRYPGGETKSNKTILRIKSENSFFSNLTNPSQNRFVLLKVLLSIITLLGLIAGVVLRKIQRLQEIQAKAAPKKTSTKA